MAEFLRALLTRSQPIMTEYDVGAEATARGDVIRNSRYDLPFLFQPARTLRLGVRFMS